MKNIYGGFNRLETSQIPYLPYARVLEAAYVALKAWIDFNGRSRCSCLCLIESTDLTTRSQVSMLRTLPTVQMGLLSQDTLQLGGSSDEQKTHLQ